MNFNFMKHTLLLITAVFVMTGFISCKSKQQTQKTVTETPPPPPPPAPLPLDGETSLNDTNVPITYRVIVSFVSFGAGIDSETREKFTAFLDNDPKKPVYEAIGWGREGEVDYCLLLKEYQPADQKVLISQIKTLVEKSDRVRVEEYKPCTHKRH
jgi:hypothetical protein